MKVVGVDGSAKVTGSNAWYRIFHHTAILLEGRSYTDERVLEDCSGDREIPFSHSPTKLQECKENRHFEGSLAGLMFGILALSTAAMWWAKS